MKDAYPLHQIDDSLRLMGRQEWLSTMDLASSYWQVAMSPDASRKAAFVTHAGLSVSGDALQSLQHAGNVRTTHGLCPVRYAMVTLFGIPG